MEIQVKIYKGSNDCVTQTKHTMHNRHMIFRRSLKCSSFMSRKKSTFASLGISVTVDLARTLRMQETVSESNSNVLLPI